MCTLQGIACDTVVYPPSVNYFYQVAKKPAKTSQEEMIIIPLVFFRNVYSLVYLFH